MEHFNRAYTERDVFGSKPAWRLREFIGGKGSSLPRLALDLGCGQGRDSIFLAGEGFKVLAVDLSSEGLRVVRDTAKAMGLAGKVETRKADVCSIALPRDRYSVVIARTILDHLPRESIPRVIQQIKTTLTPGGALFATVFTVDDPGAFGGHHVSEFAGAIKTYFQRGELLNCFEDFDLLGYQETVKEDRSHGPVHLHGKAKIAVVRRG